MFFLVTAFFSLVFCLRIFCATKSHKSLPHLPIYLVFIAPGMMVFTCSSSSFTSSTDIPSTPLSFQLFRDLLFIGGHDTNTRRNDTHSSVSFFSFWKIKCFNIVHTLVFVLSHDFPFLSSMPIWKTLNVIYNFAIVVFFTDLYIYARSLFLFVFMKYDSYISILACLFTIRPN